MPMIDQVLQTAEEWQDPEHEPRKQAVAQLLDTGIRYTEEDVTFATNQAMNRLLSAENLAPETETDGYLGLWTNRTEPLLLLDATLHWLFGGGRVALAEEASNPLLNAFLRTACPDAAVAFTPADALSETVETLAAWTAPGDESSAMLDGLTAHLADDRLFAEKASYVVAVLDGKEQASTREKLAEDALLYSGQSARNVRLIWAPKDHPPDDYLQSFADFRGVFPVHEKVPGSLRMQQAFLEAEEVSHAYAEGLAFLLSRGEPEVQDYGHIRWSEYESLDECIAWLNGSADVECVVAHEGVRDALEGQLQSGTLAPAGEVHRPDFLEMNGGASFRRFIREL